MDMISIPLPIDNPSNELPSPDEVLYWELKEKRTYWVDFEIDEEYQLLTLAKEIVKILTISRQK